MTYEDILMEKIILISEDYIGLITDITEILSKNKIKIKNIDADKINNTALIKISSDNNKYTYEILIKAGFNIIFNTEIIMVKIDDELGALAKLARKLSENNIDIRSLNIVEQDENHLILSITCSDPEKTKKLMSHMLI